MKLSQTGMGTVKLNNIDEMYPGQKYFITNRTISTIWCRYIWI